MKNILIIILCTLSIQAYSQLPGLRRIKSETADSIYLKGGRCISCKTCKEYNSLIIELYLVRNP